MLSNSTFYLLILGVALFAAALFLLTEIHGLALDNLALGCTNDWGVHAEQVAVDVEENGGRRLDDARHKRVLDQLELELLGRVVAEGRVGVREVQLEVVVAAEGVRVDALRGQRVYIVVVTCMLTEEAGAWCVVALGADLELDDHLLLLACSAQEECLLAMSALDIILSPVLVKFHL